MDIADPTQYCNLCNEQAQLMCSRCEHVFYCKAQHQKLDWRKHSTECISFDERRIRFMDNKRDKKNAVFQKLSKGQIIGCIKIAHNIIAEEKVFIAKYPKFDVEIQIEYGSSYCLLIRLLIASKEFSTAQDILTDYFKQKNEFLSNTSNIPGKPQLDQMRSEFKEAKMMIIAGKLRLISTLANLMHELIRNSVDMFQILIAHFDVVYGSESLELSNVYFYTANYLRFLNQNTKALACFLKAAKLRKQRGGTAYYNVALLLKASDRKKKALEYFHKALEMIEKEGNIENGYIIPMIFENIALVYLGDGMARLMIDYFQRAYFYYIKHKMNQKAEQIMRLFLLIRQEAREEGLEDMKIVEFPKQRKEKRLHGSISSKNRDKFRNADKVAEQDDRKTHQWLLSFKELKLNHNEFAQLKPPKELEYLFGNEMNKHEEEDHSVSVNDKYRHELSDGINMDLSYMKTLSSNEVGYLHELNRLLMDCKDPAAYFDIVQNSNFFQAINKERLNSFYRLNPRLVRPTDLDRRLMLQVNAQAANENSDDDSNPPQMLTIPTVIPPQPPKTPKLDLSKLKERQF